MKWNKSDAASLEQREFDFQVTFLLPLPSQGEDGPGMQLKVITLHAESPSIFLDKLSRKIEGDSACRVKGYTLILGKNIALAKVS